MLNPRIVFRKVGKTGLLFDPETGRIDGLNETGVFILGLCKKKITLDEILKKVLARYRVEREKVKKEAERFLEHMLRTRYITIVSHNR